jgi:mannose/cellobiose epimerase-like protein (N-acyl-D-glucosamine 2-epimerase family)
MSSNLAVRLGLVGLLIGATVSSAAADPAVRFDRIQGTLETADSSKHDLTLRLRDGSKAAVHVSDTAWVHLVMAADDIDRRPNLPDLYVLPKGVRLMASGLIYADKDELEAKEVVEFGPDAAAPVIEAADWWSAEARELARFWVRNQGEQSDLSLDPALYRTRVTKSGSKRPDQENLQETDTLSRLVYGLSSTYITTGDTWMIDAARRLVAYQRRTMRYQSSDGREVYWAHAVRNGKPVLASLFADDAGTIPLYEQIYALAGLTQYWRVTGDPEVLDDIRRSIAFMDHHFWDGAPADPLRQGYFSHADPATFDPAATTATNRLRKNWNSVGDHLPAYLINLYLGTGDPALLTRMRQLGALIVAHFPDPGSPFVLERFHQDWTPDLGYAWQQDRAVIGHNLKIAWILTSLHSVTGDDGLMDVARRCADSMMVHGEDLRRGGWYDVIQRHPDPRTGRYELVWHDRKAWWQQEQGILANYALFGTTGDQRYLETARAGSTFYNASFVDHDDGEVFFDVQGDGTPYLIGDRADKGSHSKSGYHDMELAYFAHLYTNLLVAHRPVGLHFRPLHAAEGQVLALQPIPFPKGKVRLASVTIDGQPTAAFDPMAMTVHLPRSDRPLEVTAVLAPAQP